MRQRYACPSCIDSRCVLSMLFYMHSSKRTEADQRSLRCIPSFLFFLFTIPLWISGLPNVSSSSSSSSSPSSFPSSPLGLIRRPSSPLRLFQLSDGQQPPASGLPPHPNERQGFDRRHCYPTRTWDVRWWPWLRYTQYSPSANLTAHAHIHVCHAGPALSS